MLIEDHYLLVSCVFTVYMKGNNGLVSCFQGILIITINDRVSRVSRDRVFPNSRLLSCIVMSESSLDFVDDQWLNSML